MTEVLSPTPESIARAAECLRGGGLVAFPTETVYGLGVHALDAAAVRRLFDAKERPATDPLIVHVLSFDEVVDLLGEDLETGPFCRVRRLAAQFWPGPLTMVVPKSDRVPREVTAGLDTVAIRVPSHPVARALLEAARIPVAAPSANLFSRPSPTRAEHVLQDLDGRIDMVIDGGPTDVGIESTVLDLTGDTPTVLRPGAVTLEMLRDVLPLVRTHHSTPFGAGVAGSPAIDDDAARRSPGMLEKHYAPRAQLRLYAGNPDALVDAMRDDARQATRDGRRVGVLATRDEVPRFHRLPVEVADVGHPGDLSGIASRLYAALRELDEKGVDLIMAHDLGDEEGLGRAIRDRLYRAAGEHVLVN